MAPPAAESVRLDLFERSNLSRTQFLIWLGQEIDPDVPLYNMIQTFRIEGGLDPAAFDRAWQSVVRRSDALRTTFGLRAGAPWQTVHDEMRAAVELVDLSAAPDPDAAARRWIEERKLRPIRLGERLWDSALLRLQDDLSVWYLCQHHLISDGQSCALVYRRVAEAYTLAREGRVEDAALLPPYGDFLAHERQARSSPAAAKAGRYWGAKLAEPREPTSFYGRTVSGRSARTDRRVLDLGRERSTRLREIARQPEFRALGEEMSRHAIWTALLLTTLHRITGLSQLRVGTPFLGRPTTAFLDTIGLFIEVGCLDARVDREDTFPTLVRRIQQEVMQGLLHAQPGSSSPELNRSYDVLINNVTSRFAPFAGLPVTTEWVHTGYGDRDHALRLQIADFDASGSFRLHFDLNCEVFGEVEQRWLLEQYLAVVDRFIEQPTRGVGSFDLLDAAARLHLEQWNATDADYPCATVVDLFEAQVRRTPAAVAVASGERTLSYAQLDAEANRLAHLLIARGVGPGTRVVLCLPRSSHAMVAILAVLKSGAAYVPVDPSYPPARRAAMILDSAPALVLTAGADLTADAGAIPAIDLAVAEMGLLPATAPAARPQPGDVAYVIYTSGSTGQPKGTLLTHRGLTNYLWWAREQYTGGEPLDFALYSSLSFDLTITSIFLPLICGGRVVVYQGSEHGDRLEILDVFAEDRVDVVKLTPAHLSLLRESGLSRRQRIRRLIVGGENFPTGLARAATEALGNEVAIFNEYGPTETVVGCMIHRYDPAADTGPSVPIGRPAANARIHVLDACDQPVPAGVTGEMVISGDGVALGYWQRADLTAQRFGDDPTRAGARWYRTGDLARWGNDGRLEFLGRRDHQVKIRGARIETSEIETALVAHPGIESAVVDVVRAAEDAAGAITHCRTCGIASNYPGSGFDDSGECADCRAYARHRAEVARYFRTPDDLRKVLGKVREIGQGRPQDCIVLTSGGKDSVYMLYRLVRDFGMRPLVFTLDNGYLSETALENARAACVDLGLEMHVARTPHMKTIFADSLRRHANVCDGCFKTVYTLSMSLARARGIGTIVTGLSRGQLFETRLADTFAAREFDPDRIDAWVMEARKAYHHIDDAVFQLLETDLFRNEAIFDSVRFVDFYRFIDVGLDELYRYLAAETVWKRPPDTGRSTNCLINDAGIYVHKKTRGYHNYALPYGWDVRLGHKRREAAMQELDDEIDVARVRRILDEVGYEMPVEDVHSDKRLAAWYVARGTVDPAELRAHLAATLPAYMVPSHLVPLPELPLTVNGKVDRAALPDPRRTRVVSVSAFVAPATEAERQLARIWAEVFKLDAVGVNDNFFAIGGDSITSIQVVAAARRQGLVLSAREIFECQTIAALAARIEAKAGTAGPAGVAEPAPRESDPLRFAIPAAVRARVSELLSGSGGWESVEEALPLTPTQLGMLYHSLASTDPATYFGQGACMFGAPVDASKLQQAWRRVCRRHPATRVRFAWSGLDEPLQLVQREVDFPWQEFDWRGRTVDEVRRGIEDLQRHDRVQGFALDGGALMSFTLVHTDDGAYFAWNSHHALLDGWSAHLLFDEALGEYEALVRGTPFVPGTVRPFSDYLQWLADQNSAVARQWWSEHLAGLEAAAALPLPAPADAAATGHETVVRTLDASSSARVRAFAQEQRVTLSTLANAAWALLLSHYGGTSDVVFGTTVSGREDGVPGVEGMVGMLIATLPTRVKVDADRRTGEWLQQVQRDALEARRHGHIGLAAIQRLLSLPATQPLFDSIVVVENFPRAQSRDGSSIRPAELTIGAPSNYPLALAIHGGDRIRLEAIFDRTRLSSDGCVRLLGHLEQALTSMVDGADRRLGDLPLITAGERAVLRVWGTGPRAPTADFFVHEQIAARAASDPGAFAVVSDGEVLTYADLERRSNELARVLRESGVERGHGVGLVAGGSTLLVVGVISILKAGAVYVPIDPEIPAERLAHVVAEAGLKAVLADGTFEAPGTTVLNLRQLDLDSDRGKAPASGLSADDLAYVIYTSGSTGTPKGVMVTHRNLAHSTGARFAYYREPVGAYLLLSSLAFDSSIAGLFWTLASGGTLIVPPLERRHDVGYLSGQIERHSVTHLLALPSLYRLLLEETSPGRMQSLRCVIVAGEACPVALVAAHHARCAGARLFNEYGPTEGTVWSHAFEVPDGFAGPAVPIGTPIPNSVCRVLDRFDHPSSIGVPGELVIGGPGVAAGYLQRPDLTRQSFVTLPGWSSDDAAAGERCYRTGDLVRWREDGTLDYLGRLDRQVKLRGYRIELDEVERVLLERAGVREVAVIVTDEVQPHESRRRLVAFYCADDGFDEAAWRAAAATRLPRFMLPAEFLSLAAMPQTSTGKLDRRALALLAGQSPAAAPAVREPADDLERMLRDEWVRILGRKDVGMEQSFFDLGGSSLDAMRLFACIERITGRNLLLATLLEAPTVAALAAVIRQTPGRKAIPSGTLSGVAQEEPGVRGLAARFRSLLRRRPDTLR
jgi:amino acid adenylation domain-containing protein